MHLHVEPLPLHQHNPTVPGPCVPAAAPDLLVPANGGDDPNQVLSVYYNLSH